MASSNAKKKTSTKKTSSRNGSGRNTTRTNTSKSNASKRNTSPRSGTKRKAGITGPDSQLREEILVLFVFAFALIFLLSNFNLAGTIGKGIKWFMFGLLGLVEYIFPIILAGTLVFLVSNKHIGVAKIKIAAIYVFTILLSAMIQVVGYSSEIESTKLLEFFKDSADRKLGGGLFGGMIAKLLNPMGVLGSYIILLILMIICIIIITEKSFIGGVRNKSTRMYQTAREDYEVYREHSAEKREIQSERDIERELKREQDREKRIQQKEIQRQQKLERQAALSEPRTNKKARGVTLDTTIPKELGSNDSIDIHEITVEYDRDDEFTKDIYDPNEENTIPENNSLNNNSLENDSLDDNDYEGETETQGDEEMEEVVSAANEATENDIQQTPMVRKKKKMVKYVFPPISLLTKSTNSKMSNGQDRENKETAIRLQQTLQNFGVKVTITDISCGPAVTRYELQPEQGVKVSRIVSLADDIKLNLAAADIRIEAPIPGKAAVGIEVPNKENKGVLLRELLETDAFKKHPSAIAFAAGKDIAGKTMVADIAKMPHLLIAGATGSGKSVCINTIIMSILYKAHPDDVKLIMVDPKVVELSVYNGIPHLMIPVVTDPKKASGALNWAVAEMTERYKKFANMNVRDLKGYNAKVEELDDGDDDTAPKKMPQIVIIIDELADLMMVAPGEVEDAICRLAQLARAAGIHLVIATQRPSVNVITGLIKANVPSRIAFSVSSGVDSRTIIDMNGAEKLLGKGDMLFFPSGYPKPVRVQGAFVSDGEVGKVVDFLKEHMTEDVSYSEEITTKIETATFNDSQAFGGDRDEYFAEAGKFIIEKEKGSIGMLQRYYKIGFNRAARIMDQLSEEGVVGAEEGTKPRKILMTLEEFEQILNQ